MSLTFEDSTFNPDDLWQKFDLFEDVDSIIKTEFFGGEDWDSLDGEGLFDKDILTGEHYDEDVTNADKFLLRDCMWSGRCVDESISKTPVVKKEPVETKKPNNDSLLLNNIKKTCNEQRLNKQSLNKPVQPGRSLLLRSRYNNPPQPGKKIGQTNLLPVNQGFNSLNLLQVIKQVEDNVDNFDKKFNMFPSPPDSSEENENDDDQNKTKSILLNPDIKIKQEPVDTKTKNDFDLFNNKKLFSLSDSEESGLDFDNDMFSDNECFTFKSFNGFDNTKIKLEMDSEDEESFNLKTKIKKEPVSPKKTNDLTRFRQQQEQQQRIVRNNPCETDHCYSLLKHDGVRDKSLDRNMMGMLGVQTPSDSEEEEIDVVSLGVSHNQPDSGYYNSNISSFNNGKANLPTCPSKQDRRQLQLEVTRKISESSSRINNDLIIRRSNVIPESQIVKQPGGLKTLVPRSRPSYNNSSRDDSDDDYEVPSSKTKSNPKTNRKRKRDKSASSDDEFDMDYSQSQEFSTSANESSSSSQLKPMKKRGRKRRSDDDNVWNNHNGVERSSRSAHNDMERRRRVGLRVLFEELRQAVPQLSSREKAPKVSILREAGALCRELRAREEEMKFQKREQKRLLERVRELRRELASSRA